MSRVEIERAAKRAGFKVLSAHYDWTPTPGEMVASWEVRFQDAAGQFEPETEYFPNTPKAIEYFSVLPERWPEVVALQQGREP